MYIYMCVCVCVCVCAYLSDGPYVYSCIREEDGQAETETGFA